MARIEQSISPETESFTPDADLTAPPLVSAEPESLSTGNSVDEFLPWNQDNGASAQGDEAPWSGPTVSADSLSRAPLVSVPPTLGLGSRGPEVVALQALLQKAGFSVGSTGADGIFGHQTEKAVAAFLATLGGSQSSGTMDTAAWWQLDAAKARAQVDKRAGDFSHRTADGTPRLKQGDPAWSGHPLGAPNQSGLFERKIGQAGCTLTSLAMIVSQRLKHDVSPLDLNRALLKHGAFSGPNINDWNKVEEALRADFGLDLKASRRPNITGADVAQLADASLAAGRPLIIGVRYDGVGKVAHYLVVQRKERSATGREDYVVLDPASGKEVRYGLDAQGRFKNREPDADGRARVAVDATLF